jgi:hypothetical protein
MMTMKSKPLALLTNLYIAASLLTCMAGCDGSSSDSIDVPDADPTATFATVYPPSNTTVASNLIELRGVGLRQMRGLSVEVLTDGWYPQTGELHVSSNNSWSYYPVYLEGQGTFNLHSIRVTVTHTDGSVESVTIRGVIRGP